MTQRHESSVILTKTNDENHVQNCYRLIQTIDIFHGIHIFSVFLTTTAYGITDEEFVYDIAHEAIDANHFFRYICENQVTASTLLDVAKDFLSD